MTPTYHVCVNISMGSHGLQNSTFDFLFDSKDNVKDVYKKVKILAADRFLPEHLACQEAWINKTKNNMVILSFTKVS